MRRSTILGFCFFLVTGVLAIFAARHRSDPKNISARASVTLHQQFKEANFRDMYRQASPYLQHRISEGAFIDRMRGLRQRLGDQVTLAPDNRLSALFPLRPITDRTGTSLRVDYLLTAASDTCDEFIYWDIADGEGKLTHYTVYCDSDRKVVSIP